MELRELRKIPVLKAINDEQLEIIYSNARERDFKKREIIFEPNGTDNYIMIVIEGKVRAYFLLFDMYRQ